MTTGLIHCFGPSFRLFWIRHLRKEQDREWGKGSWELNNASSFWTKMLPEPPIGLQMDIKQLKQVLHEFQYKRWNVYYINKTNWYNEEGALTAFSLGHVDTLKNSFRKIFGCCSAAGLKVFHVLCITARLHLCIPTVSTVGLYNWSAKNYRQQTHLRNSVKIAAIVIIGAIYPRPIYLYSISHCQTSMLVFWEWHYYVRVGGYTGWAKKTGTLFVRFNFIYALSSSNRHWSIFKLVSLSESGEHLHPILQRE